jgi:Cu-Zn family superoxide dismutase
MKKYLLILLLICSSCINHKFERAIVKLEPVKGSKISGIVILTQEKGGVALNGEFKNLYSKNHALHIHKYGDVTKDDGSGTGPHYYGHNYHEGNKILGNLGSVPRKKINMTKYKNFFEGLTIDKIIGRSMVIHAKKGSKKYSKFINSGKRVATGVIGVASHDN